MNKVLRLPINLKGRDIIVADPHGQFHLLKKALKAIQFNKHEDRLIIAGDLVDKGSNSEAAAKWLKKPYCYAAMGNHDAQFAFIHDSDKFSQSITCSPFHPWFLHLGGDELEAFCSTLRNRLYPAIEIETASGLVGVIHGEVPESLSWPDVVSRLNQLDYDLLHDCMWGRNYANKAVRNTTTKKRSTDFVEGVSHVFHGHSPSKKLQYYPYRMANRYFIDTAAYKANMPDQYPTAGITLFDIAHPDKPLYTTGAMKLKFADEIDIPLCI